MTSSVYTSDDISCLSYTIPTSLGISHEIVQVGKVFENKLELKTKVHLYAMKMNFEFVVKKSGTDVWYITCKDEECGWRLRARKLAKSEMFEITRFTDKHTCSLDLRHKDHRQAAPWVIGHCIKKKYQTGASDYLSNNIREDIKNNYGIEMTYGKAWRCREKALMYVRGTLEESYQKLPSYLFTLQHRNPGTLTDFVLEDERFKYCFMSLGVCRRGFSSCRPVICVDGTFLKTKYGGQLLCATALDANNHIYPIAFGIVDSENHDSWTYFMSKLKESIGEVENLAFISDRHASIVHALDTIFPDAYHGACYHHISMNVIAKFKTDHCHVEMWAAAYSFRNHEFQKYFDKIKVKDLAIANYLSGIGFEKWARPFFPGNRYNIMTSNYAESFNNTIREARSYPITALVESIRYTLQGWFCKHRSEIEKITTTLSPSFEVDVSAMVEKARFVIPYGIGQFEFHVVDGEYNGQVNLLNKTCSCGVFQLIGIPCVHALSAVKQRGVSLYSLCSDYYKIPCWKKSYEETIYPCGNEEEWEIPNHIKFMQVGTPVHRNPVGRPKKKLGRTKKKRHPSQGEILVVKRKCSTCGGRGHNRSTCKARI